MPDTRGRPRRLVEFTNMADFGIARGSDARLQDQLFSSGLLRLQTTCNNRGIGQENGSVEEAHGHP